MKPNAAAAEKWRRALDAAQGFTHLLLERDLRVLAGTDVPFGGILPGQSLWRELALLVEAGLEPIGALEAATAAAADFLERPELGRLQKGAAADMAIVHGDLRQGIPDRPQIELVVRGGATYRPDQLLHAAETIDSSWRDDPWGRQFAQHGHRRASADRPGPRE